MANTLYSFDGGNPANQNQTIAPGIAPIGVTPPTELGDTVVITSTGGNGTIQGFTIDSAGGNDTVSLNGSPNVTNLTLGSGNDILNIATSILGGSITSSEFAGAAGNDTFNLLANGVGAAATLFGGGNGADLFNLQGNYDNVTVGGGADRDRVQFTAGGGKFTNSLFRLGAGDDTLQDQLFGIIVDGTTVEGGGEDDLIDFRASTAGTGVRGLSIGGGFGDDFIFGTKSGENTVGGGGGNDYIQTFAGNDSVRGGAGVDTIFTGTGNDNAFGGGEADLIFGEAGQDTLSGGDGADIVVGGFGDDLLFGNAEDANDQSDDTLIGGEGDDTAVASSGDNWIFGDGVDALQGLFDPFDIPLFDTIDWTVGVGTAPYTFGFGNENIATVIPPAVGSVIPVPSLGNGISSSIEFWLEANPDLNPASIANLAKVTKDQLQGLTDIDNILVNNTPGINPNTLPVAPGNGGAFVAVQLGDDSLQGNSGNDVIFGGASALIQGFLVPVPGFGPAYFTFGDWSIDNDTIEGNGGDDVIMGGLGADSMSGGIGNDLFLQEFGASNVVAFSLIPPSIGLESGNNLNITFQGAGPDRVDVITDFKAADSIGAVIDQLSFQGWNGRLQNNLGAATNGFLNGDVVLYSGIYNSVAGTFITTSNLAGPDVLAFKAAGSAIGGVDAFDAGDFGDQAVVLLGASKEAFSIANFV